ncbi:ketoacyl-ACP synthase III [Nocardia sp. NBC_00508]|uniref:3-oxoacyl-ACP synthase III family protein n=1 Tax=Nocardia sp. NBC_00508 TaxID=2975992 RepID=UPI002E8018E9|nr:ketoacyl-ACP synthase III [Nocardia sp. NBC_00508]WUD65857.1 ketoacyl-ACP synthase III [Nocardia sp. NBC_00508]
MRTNEEVAAHVGVTPHWITERTGVRNRYVAGRDQAASDLAAEAVRGALRSAGMVAGDLDLIVLATSTPDELGPSTACRLQALLGAERAVALDVSAACAGWLFATRVAVDWLRVDTDVRRAVVVGVEVYSRFLNLSDRATAVLFGDGAAATILGPVAPGSGFGHIGLGSDGRQAGDVLIPAGGSREPVDIESIDRGRHRIHMNGRAVRDFILDVFPKAAEDALKRSSLSVSEIDAVVAHQPNPVLLRQACKDAGFDPDRLIVVGDQVGNIGAASMPYGLAEAHADGRLCRGDHVLIVGFGAGLTWGSTVLTWDTDTLSLL